MNLSAGGRDVTFNDTQGQGTIENDDNFVKLTIKDQGIGIEKNEIEKIKRPFFRAKNALKIKGSGIGFALTSKIIHMHDGLVHINSVLSEGTEIEISLPFLK